LPPGFRDLVLWSRRHCISGDPRVERESPLLRTAAPPCLLPGNRVRDITAEFSP
jgi:hypothetical protein